MCTGGKWGWPASRVGNVGREEGTSWSGVKLSWLAMYSRADMHVSGGSRGLFASVVWVLLWVWLSCLFGTPGSLERGESSQ